MVCSHQDDSSGTVTIGSYSCNLSQLCPLRRTITTHVDETLRSEMNIPHKVFVPEKFSKKRNLFLIGATLAECGVTLAL